MAQDMTHQDRMNAYARLTRVLRAMHHTERTMLDSDPSYGPALLAVHEGRDADALTLTAHIRTAAGDAKRAALNPEGN